MVFCVQEEARRSSVQDANVYKVLPENTEITLRKTLRESIQNNHDINKESSVNFDTIKFAQVTKKLTQ